MDLALCLFKYFPYGGLQRDCLKIAKAALAKQHRVTCYTMAWEGEVPKGLLVKLIDAKGASNHQQCLNFSKQLSACLAEANHDAVLTFNRVPGCDFYFAGDPCFKAELNNKKHAALKKLLPRYRTFLDLEKNVFAKDSKTHILLLNPGQKTIFQDYYQTPDERFHVIPPGIAKPAESISKADARQTLSLPIPADATWLLMVGHDLQRKGLDRNLHALAYLSKALDQKVYLVVVGAHKLDYFKKMARALGIEERVCFLGNRDGAYELMQAADLLLHPAYQETAGMVLVEALVNGLPVMCTEDCGYAFHITAAKAGELISQNPFSQVEYNERLLAAIQALPSSDWSRHALAYVEGQKFHDMPGEVLGLLESFSLKT